jgi:hypothetical protein
VGAWYTIGLAAGLGGGLGVLLAGVIGVMRGGILVAVPLALVAGGALAYAFWDWPEIVAGALGGALAAVGAIPMVAGALARGGTRVATAVLVALGAVVVAALAFVPLVGYVESLVIAVRGLRLRRRAGRTYAGLRILARD